MTTSSLRRCARRRCSPLPTTCSARSRTSSRPTGSLPGSTGGANWPRALGQRSLLAHPGHAENLERLNAVKGREQFRPVALMVLVDRADEIFNGGPIPSPYMLFVHRVAPEWIDRIPAVVHVDGTARIQTVDEASQPRLAGGSAPRAPDRPVVINTSSTPRDVPWWTPRGMPELFGSTPVDALVLGGHSVRRAALTAQGSSS